MSSYPYRPPVNPQTVPANPQPSRFPPPSGAYANPSAPVASYPTPPVSASYGHSYPQSAPVPSYPLPPASTSFGHHPPPTGYDNAVSASSYPQPPSNVAYAHGYPAPSTDDLSSSANTSYSEYDYEGAGTASNYNEDPSLYQYNQTYSNTTTAAHQPDVYACDPRFMSLTVGSIPKSAAVRLKAKLPIALVVQPLAPTEYETRAINFGLSGVIRCRACRAYINPFVEFKDNYGLWICNLCGRQNELPSSYVQEIRNPESRLNHPELSEASFEIIAPPEYTVRSPQPPTFIFMIDVSHRAITSGMVSTVCQSIAASLDELPGKPRTNVSFITFDSTVHVYCLKNSNKLPSVFVLPDIEDLHLPVPADLLVNLDESRALVDQLLDSIPRMYSNNKDPENSFGPALNVAIQIGHRIGGKIICFTSGLPNQGEGALKNRDNPRLYGTDKEHTLLQPASKHFRSKAETMTTYHLMCDLFVFPDQYVDIATLGELAQYSGGQLLYYPGFNQIKDTERVSNDIYRVLTREQSWEAVFRVRASRGLKITEYYGNFFKRSQDLLAVPNADADKAYAIEFVNEENAIPTPLATFQSALLYSNSNGERRLRIHTVVAPVANDAVELFNSINVSTMINYNAKKAVAACKKSSVQTAREIIQFACTETITAYKRCVSNSKLLSLADYPPSFSMLPLMTLGLLKNVSFKDGTDVSIEARAAHHLDLNSMGLVELDLFIHPKLFRIDDFKGDEGLYDENGFLTLPSELSLTSAQLSSDSAFLLNNGRTFYLRLGRSLKPTLLTELFNISSLENLNVETLQLRYPEVQEGTSNLHRLWNILGYFRSQSSVYQDIKIIRESDPSELRFYDMLICDRTMSVMSLDEFVNYLSGLS